MSTQQALLMKQFMSLLARGEYVQNEDVLDVKDVLVSFNH